MQHAHYGFVLIYNNWNSNRTIISSPDRATNVTHYMYIHIHLYLFHIPTSLACFLSPPVSFSHSKRQLTILYLLLHLHVLYTPYITQPTDLVLFLISSFLVINGIKTRYYDRTKKRKGMQRFIMSRYLIRQEVTFMEQRGSQLPFKHNLAANYKIKPTTYYYYYQDLSDDRANPSQDFIDDVDRTHR